MLKGPGKSVASPIIIKLPPSEGGARKERGGRVSTGTRESMERTERSGVIVLGFYIKLNNNIKP